MVSSQTKFELIQAFMHVLVTCKNEDDSIKNEGARAVTTFFLLYVYVFFRRSRVAYSAALSPIWPFQTHPRLYDCSCTCKYEKDPIKNEGGRVFTILYINFSDAQGQIIPESVVVSG